MAVYTDIRTVILTLEGLQGEAPVYNSSLKELLIPVADAISANSGLATSKEDASNKSTSTGDSASSVKFPVWSAVVTYVTGLGYLLASTAASTYQAILTATNFGSFINGLTAKATPVDADYFTLMDSADSNKAKKFSWLSLKTHVSSYIGFKDVHVADSSVTGTTSQTIVDSLLIPAGTGGIGKAIIYFPRFRKTGTAGTVLLRGYINTSATVGGSNFYAPAIYSAATLKATANKFGLIKSTTNTEFFSNVAEDLSVISSTSAVSTFNIDWTVDQYLVVTVQLTSAADTGIYSGHLFEIK